MIPTVFAAAFTVFPKSRQAMVTPLIGLIATLAPTIGPTVGGYLTDAHVVALAVLHQRRTRRRRHRCRAGADRFRQAGLFAARSFRLVGPDRDGGLPRRRSNTCWRKAPATTGWRTRPSRYAALVSALVGGGVLLSRFHRARADRRPARLRQPQLRDRQHVFLRARHRALWADLSLSGLSGPGARLQFADDRRNHVRVGARDVRHRAASSGGWSQNTTRASC